MKRILLSVPLVLMLAACDKPPVEEDAAMPAEAVVEDMMDAAPDGMTEDVMPEEAAEVMDEMSDVDAGESDSGEEAAADAMDDMTEADAETPAPEEAEAELE